MKKIFKTDIFLFPFLKDLKGYKFKFFKSDVFSSLSVALLTIPQSIAYALLAGLPPSAGIFAAIFGTIFVGGLGSSKYFIAGPTTAIAILLQTTIFDTMNNYFPQVQGVARDILSLNILSHVVLIIGVFQLLFGLFNMGKILHFVSRSVILGYFVGVIIAILINQLFPFLGIKDSLSSSGGVIFKLKDLFLHFKEISISTVCLGLFAIFILIFTRKKFPKLPSPFLMIIIISFFAWGFNHFSSSSLERLHIFLLKDLNTKIFPVMLFAIPKISFKIIGYVFMSSLAIGMLSILETFSVSKTISSESGEKIDYNQQIFAFGFTNIILSFLHTAMPASSSISRTVFNYRSGAKSRISSVLCGLFIIAFIFLGWKFIEYIPLVALSAILIAIVPTFLDYQKIRFCFLATKGDAFAFLLTMFSCLFFNLNIAFFIGIAISILFYLKKASVPHVVEYAFNTAGRLVIISNKKKIHRKIRIIGIAGELFFATVDLLQSTIQKVADDPYVKVIILRLNNVYHIDASMCFAILNLHRYLRKTNRHLLISGITEEVAEIFMKAKLKEKFEAEDLFLTDETKPQLSTWEACIRARELLES